ncbi:MAG: BrnT family toxin [Chloroflexi bacterium]|nr:BrnT family toxin [Chloroflexota bacterium]
MKPIRFTWDPDKETSNLSKHGVSFTEAKSVFLDENGIEFYDDEHSEWEDRFLLLGFSTKLRLLMICHCYRSDEGIIHIISARKATNEEAKYYKR